MMRRLCGLGLLLVLGCGPSRGEVSGTVKYKNKAVKSGTVTFFSSVDNTAYAGTIKSDGTYVAENVPVGKATVVVVSLDPSKKPLSESRTEGKGRESPNEGKGARPEAKKGKATADWEPLPSKYADPTATPLAHDVQAGKSTFDIKLE